MEPTCSTCGGTGFEIRSHADGLTSATPCVCSQLQRGDRLLRHMPRRPRLDRGPLVEGARRSSLDELTDWVVWADQTITF